jgi:glutamate racemase
MNNSPIGIFDSGFGGLTVARAIRERLPHESLIYFGDTKRCPYGPRSLEEVCTFTKQICTWLSKQNVKLIVIACNTATAAGLAMAQREFNIPIIGVIEPGARAAVRTTRNRKVGVLATQGTVNSGAYTQAIHALDAGAEVVSSAAAKFVDIVEDGLRKEDASEYMQSAFSEVAESYLAPIKKAQVDTVVLGCTHFPILSGAIRKSLGSNVTLVSSAAETAKDVAETLAYRNHLCAQDHKPRYKFATTEEDLEEFKNLGQLIFDAPVDDLAFVEIEDL